MPHLSPLFTWRSAIVDSNLPSRDRLVAICLSLHMSERGDSCYPGLDRLARETGFSKSTVSEALNSIEAAGYILRERSKGGNGKTTRYTAVIPLETLEKLTDPAPESTVREPDSLQLDLNGNCPADGPKLSGSRTGGRQEDVVEVANATSTPTETNGRKPDPIFEALAEGLGVPLIEVPRGKNARGKWNSAVADLKADHATPEGVRAVCALWRDRHPDEKFWTPTAIATHYPQLIAEAKSKSPEAQRDAMRRVMDQQLAGTDYA